MSKKISNCGLESMAIPPSEKKPLKKPKLGPPDIYPQEPKQKEDELTHVNVKQGFTPATQILDEHGSARNSNISAAKIGPYFSSIISKKQDLNTFQDTNQQGRKKQQINPKDNFWPVTQRSQNAIEVWFKDLAGGKALTILAKKIPNFNKKEEIFVTLHKYSVPTCRAAWFIKMCSAYTVAISEAKIKKRQLVDPSNEWAVTLCKFMKEQFVKLLDCYHTNNNPVANQIEVDNSFNLWQYCNQLARYMFEEGLLDKHEYLSWLLELLEKSKSSDDGILKLILPLILQYVDDYVYSELLSRRLAHFCCKKINQLCTEIMNENSSPRSQSPTSNISSSGNTTNAQPANNSNPSNPVMATFIEFASCSHHRNLILSLSVVIQVVTMECPTALVWNNIGEGKHNSVLNGSPLDLLPCAPSCLPMPPGSENIQVRNELRLREKEIRNRGRAAEVRWSASQWQQTAAGSVTNRILQTLDSLDKHSFEKVDSSNSLDTLYNRIFSTKENSNFDSKEDQCIVQLLCRWAVTTQRSGEHRALIVAKLLERRQNEIFAEKFSGDDGVEDKESLLDATFSSLPIYHYVLMEFLDNDAPILSDDGESNDGKKSFTNLVLLFSELIRCNIFSHDTYMCSLISRGCLNSVSGSSVVQQPSTPGLPASMKSAMTPDGPNIGHMSSSDQKQNISGSMQMSMVPPPQMMQINQHHDSNSKSEFGMSESRGMFGSLIDPSKNAQKHESDVMDTIDDSRIDDDLGEILQHIKEGQQNMIDPPDSVGSDKDLPAHTPLSHPPTSENVSHQASSLPNGSTMSSTPSRHLQYTMHFPLPQDESSGHDSNQRHILLFGVGKARDEAVKGWKKVMKEILKLFGKKSCIDSSKGSLEGSKIKRYSREYFESLVNRFKNLSYFDQHMVTSACATAVLDMLQSFSSNSSYYLPIVDYISFVFDLMEMALNINGLIDFAIQLIKIFPEVDVFLASRSNALHPSYTQSLVLYCVGVLRRYHTCLLVSQEQTAIVFDALCKVVKNVTNPTDCSSAERCILVHLYDLYSSCNFLRQSKHSEPFNVAYPKVKQSLFTSIEPSALNLLWNTSFMIEYMNNPRMKVSKDLIRQLNENPGHRYSFLCNAIVNICNAQDYDKLNDISILCAELTAACPCLSSEWLGVLKALCCSSNHGCGFIDVLTQVDVGDLSIHDSLTVFTAILISRHCFSLQDFVIHVALLSLLSACPSAGGGDQDAEPGARLTCHILLRLFKTIDTPSIPFTAPQQNSLPSTHPNSNSTSGSVPISFSPCPISSSSNVPGSNSSIGSQKSNCYIKLSCDRHLLAAAYHGITVGAVLAVLKAILVLGDATSSDSDHKSKSEQSSGKSSELSISDILGTIDDSDSDLMSLGPVNAKSSSNVNGLESAGLSEFAKHALLQICNQDWVYEKCLKDPDILCTPELLLDSVLSNRQAQQLLQLICHPGSSISNDSRTDSSSTLSEECKQYVSKILQNLDQWTLRVSWLELLLMYKQSQASDELNAWSESLARGTIDIFQLTSSNDQNNAKSLSSKNNSAKSSTPNSSTFNSVSKRNKENNIWLVAPLISKLPSAVQGRVLKAAAHVLESGNWSSKSKDKDKNVQKSTSLLSQQPFLQLVLTCLKGQDEQRESLLNSLNSQLSQYLHLSRDDKLLTPDDPKVRQAILDSIRLRLSLVGGMFDTIQRSTAFTNDWVILFVQLASHGVIDTQNNSELFTTILDMLAVLIHSNTIAQAEANNSEKNEQDNKKHHLNTIYKKIKKELMDKDSDAIKMIRQLLPIPKFQCEVIACEAMGSLVDTKGNKIQGFDSIDKKQGLQVAEKQMVSPWDLLEGHKNPAPLSWSWFGAVKMERKPLRYEEEHRLLLYHTHSMKRPSSYYLDPPQLPPEDLEPPPTPVILEKAMPHPALLQDVGVKKPAPPGMPPMDHAQRGLNPLAMPPEIGTGRGRKPKQQRRKRPRGGMANSGQARGKTTSPVRHMYQDPNMYGGGPPGPPGPPGPHAPPGPQGWYGQQQPIQQQPGQQAYYSQQPLPPASGPRFGPPLSQSKAALSNMLRQRHPGAVPAQYIANGESSQGPYQNIEMMKQRQIMQIRAQQSQGMQNNPNAMYAQSMQNPQSTPLHHLPPQQQNLAQGYSGFNNNQANIQQAPPTMVDNQSSNIPSYNQNYQSTNSNMMTGGGLPAPPQQSQNPAQQQQYISQAMAQRSMQQQTARNQYQMSQGNMQPTQGMNISQQMGQNQQYPGHMQQMQTAQNQPNQQQMHRQGQAGQPTSQHMQHLRQQHQPHNSMHAIQQKQQQQQTAALVAQLRGQLSSGNSSSQQQAQAPSQQQATQQQHGHYQPHY